MMSRAEKEDQILQKARNEFEADYTKEQGTAEIITERYGRQTGKKTNDEGYQLYKVTSVRNESHP